MLRFSCSCLSTYENCSYSCKLQYNVMGEDKLLNDTNFYGEFGALLHDLFDRYYKDDLAKSDMVIEFYRKLSDLKCEFPDGKKGDYIDSALEQIDYFYEKYADIKPVATEQEFDEFFIEGVPLHFKGFIDRIDGSVEEKEVVLSDYKTGRSSKFTKRELEDNIQATVYSLWFREKFGFLPTRFVFIFTKERRTKEIAINEAFIERGLERIRRITKAIEDGIFVPEAKGGVYFCKNFCNFYSECPKFEKKSTGSGWDI